jgi:hypothetical protein
VKDLRLVGSGAAAARQRLYRNGGALVSEGKQCEFGK